MATEGNSNPGARMPAEQAASSSRGATTVANHGDERRAIVTSALQQQRRAVLVIIWYRIDEVACGYRSPGGEGQIKVWKSVHWRDRPCAAFEAGPRPPAAGGSYGGGNPPWLRSPSLYYACDIAHGVGPTFA